MSHVSARSRIDAEEISVRYLYKVMKRLFPKNNDCAPFDELNEVVEELVRFDVRTKKKLRLLLKKHRKQLLRIDREPLDKAHQRLYREDLGESAYRDCIRRQYWFCYPALVRTAMEIEFGEEYDRFARERDGT